MDLLIFEGRQPQDSICGIEQILLEDGRAVFIVTELDNNPGQSVSNCWENVVSAALYRYEVKPLDAVWVEHYPGQTLPRGPYEILTYTESADGKANAKWRDMTPDDWLELGLPPRE